ncbi:MAG TPA: hypothetical protein VHV10_05505, partial [Ktedonobacteraceae bacterium]|nr:hypothetical protein [Ktedonobacteraceae bacterium]
MNRIIKENRFSVTFTAKLEQPVIAEKDSILLYTKKDDQGRIKILHAAIAETVDRYSVVQEAESKFGHFEVFRHPTYAVPSFYGDTIYVLRTNRQGGRHLD